MNLLNRYTNAVIFSAEVETVKELVRAALAAGANLSGADLSGANPKINDHPVISINGTAYPLLITDTHLRAGCQNHTFAAWRAMSPGQIFAMDGQKTTDFYPVLIGIMDSLCKDRETAQEVENV